MDWLGLVRGIRPRKALGQSFLVHAPTLEALADAWSVGPQDEVFEIGTGPGNLTAALAARARRVWTVEIDPKLAWLARRTVRADNVIWIEGDVRPLIERIRFGQPMRVVGNLPYSSYREILLALLAWDSPLLELDLMVQEDVAKKFEQPGPWRVLLSGFGRRRALRVPRNRFYPQPRVDSVAVRLSPEQGRGPIDAARLERGLKRIFASRGRTLRAFAKRAGTPLGGETSGMRPARAPDAVLLELADRITRAREGA